MNIRQIITTAFLVPTLSLPSLKAAEDSPVVELGAPFTDNAILQREMQVPVWGWSKPGIKVTVTFAGQKKIATAGNDGKWMLKLDPFKANVKPQEMVVTQSTGQTRTLKNILVGEVWLASGQSKACCATFGHSSVSSSGSLNPTRRSNSGSVTISVV